MGADDDLRSIPRMALVSADRFADESAVLDGDVRLTFDEVAEGMLAVAGSLLAGGVEPGDRVALWAPNSASWITAALGVLATGAWLVPLNTRFKGAEAAYVLAKTQARTLLCVNGFLGIDHVAMLRTADVSLPLRETIVMDGHAPEGCVRWDEFLQRGSEVDESAIRARIDAIEPGDVSDVLFTSGTTGHPKGVMLRHGTSLRCFRDAFNEGYKLGRGDRTLIVPPFFHCFGYKAGWMLALMVGATTVPVAVFDPRATLETIERLGITHLGGPPTMYWSILDHPSRSRRDLSSLRVGIASAAYVPVELVARMRSELGLDHVVSGYGLTEAHALVSISLPGDSDDSVAEWSGRVVEGVEFRIVGETGGDVPVGERGELLVRGFNLMTGYYDDPEGTAAVIDEHGWLHTGDVAYANADRYIKVCDRKKEMFIVGGFNVAPAEVEGILINWDRVAAAAVVATADPVLGEVGVAFVVPAPGCALDADAVIAYGRENMASYKVPRRVEIVDALPLNATGKVLKSELRARLSVGS